MKEKIIIINKFRWLLILGISLTLFTSCKFDNDRDNEESEEFSSGGTSESSESSGDTCESTESSDCERPVIAPPEHLECDPEVGCEPPYTCVTYEGIEDVYHECYIVCDSDCDCPADQICTHEADGPGGENGAYEVCLPGRR